MPEKKLVEKEATAIVERTVLNKEDPARREKFNAKLFQTTPASITVKAGETINLGNYSSARVDVMLTFPCYVEEIDETYPKVRDWVNSRLNQECETIEKDLKAGR